MKIIKLILAIVFTTTFVSACKKSKKDNPSTPTNQVMVTTFAGSGSIGSTNGRGISASFNNPTGVAVDASGNIYIADSGNNLIRKITIN
jgi:hypothetical protein